MPPLHETTVQHSQHYCQHACGIVEPKSEIQFGTIVRLDVRAMISQPVEHRPSCWIEHHVGCPSKARTYGSLKRPDQDFTENEAPQTTTFSKLRGLWQKTCVLWRYGDGSVWHGCLSVVSFWWRRKDHRKTTKMPSALWRFPSVNDVDWRPLLSLSAVSVYLLLNFFT